MHAKCCDWMKNGKDEWESRISNRSKQWTFNSEKKLGILKMNLFYEKWLNIEKYHKIGIILETRLEI